MADALAKKYEAREHRRHSILAAARELLKGGGERALGISNILDSAGFASTNAFYDAFPGGIEEVKVILRREGLLLDAQGLADELCEMFGCELHEVMGHVRALQTR